MRVSGPARACVRMPTLIRSPQRTTAAAPSLLLLRFLHRQQGLSTLSTISKHRPAPCQRLQPASSPSAQQHRHLHARIDQPPVPKPTPFVPDAQTFLTLIGRGLAKHASKIPSWDALFSLTSPQLRDLGVEPARTRRYLLRWRDKFRRGEYGAGGALVNVGEDGRAEIRVVDVPLDAERGAAGERQQESASTSITPRTMMSPPPRAQGTINRTPDTRKILVNVPPSLAAKASSSSSADTPSEATSPSPSPAETPDADAGADMGVSEHNPTRVVPALQPISAAQALALPRIHRTAGGGIYFSELHGLYGRAVEPIKGSQGKAAIVRVREGLWEHVRGHKVDGGERRKALVRFKRRAAERRAVRA